MSKSNAFETDFLALIYNATAIADLAENDSTSPATNIAVSLHTADPGEAGTALTNEATYTGYARVNVARTSSGWTVSGNSVTNAAAVTFDECTAGSDTITYFATSVPGTDRVLHKGQITSPASGLAVSAGITPEFAIGTLTITED